MNASDVGWGERGRWQLSDNGRRLLLGMGTVLTLTLLLVFLPLRPLIGIIGVMAACLLLIRRPWLLWVGLGVVLPVTSGIAVGSLRLSDLILAGGVALWFADGVRRRQLRLMSHPLIPVLALFIGVQYLSLLQTANLREALAEVLKWVQFGLVLAIVPTMLPRNGAQWLVIGLLLGGVLQGLLGIYQFIFRIGPEWFIIMDRFMRASGTFNQPNPYGGYLGLTLPVAVSLGLWSLNRLRTRLTKSQPSARVQPFAGGDSNPTEKQFQPTSCQPTRTGWTVADERKVASPLISGGVDAVWYLGAAATIGAGLLASWSRGGWLGAVGALAIVVGLRSRRSALLSSVVALLIGGTLLVGTFGAAWIPTPVMERFADVPAYFGLTDVLSEPLTDENFAIVERIAHWVAAVRMWERAPWLGVGPGNYGVIYPEVRLPLWEEALGHAHNIYLNLLAESGLLGLLTYLLLWLAISLWLWQQKEKLTYDKSWQEPFILGVIGVVVHLSIHNFFDNLFVQGSYLHIALWLAAVSHLSFQNNDCDAAR